MSPAVANLPKHLDQYLSKQVYENYTAREHASWRYIMRQNRAFFSQHAHEIYMKGLDATGIPLDRIPNIDEMDSALAAFGWGAVPVTGFIPPAAFLEFQALKVLPIAVDMRTLEHIAYTPAPDIVHEAAGHAPIVANPEYRDYLQQYARVAEKSIMSSEDVELYEAIRRLSDIKENPEATQQDIEDAQKFLDDSSARVSFVSEAAKVARMAWWTTEYGLIGDLKQQKIYGAGLLSSIGESQACLSDHVKKVPLTLECIEQSYDITEPQPQLFVTPSFAHLRKVLTDLEKTMAFSVGGVEGLFKAKRAKTVNTVVLDSGVEMSGQLTESLEQNENVQFVKFTGPVQLATEGKELEGHGISYHEHGFSSPIGRWKGVDKSPADLSSQELVGLGIKKGERYELTTDSGFKVEGRVDGWLHQRGKLVIVSFVDATVVGSDGKRYFEPDWGTFDMAVGETVTSVYGGPADKEAYGVYDIGKASTTPGRSTPFSAKEKAVFKIYQQLRNLRLNNVNGVALKQNLQSLASELTESYPAEWLAAVEVLELAGQRLQLNSDSADWLKSLCEQVLEKSKKEDKGKRWLIEQGEALFEIPD